MMGLDKKWQKIVKNISYLFEPIVNPQSGELFGVEAKINGAEKQGYTTYERLFDDALKDGVLFDVDIELRRKVFSSFSELQESINKSSQSKNPKSIKLFYSLDARVVESVNYKPGATLHLLKELGIQPSSVYFSISERRGAISYVEVKNAINVYSLQGFKISLSRFGSGSGGVELLYHCEPNAVEIDALLTRNVKQNVKNRLFNAEIVKLAHMGGSMVIANGVESKEDFFTLKELGCDLIKGSFIQEPCEAKNIPKVAPHIKKLSEDDKRSPDSDASHILNQMQTLPPVQNTDPIKDVIEKFQKDEKAAIFPVVDSDMRPIGVVTEKNLRKYIYSQYGLQLISNQQAGKYTVHAPVADIKTSLEDILDTFANHEELEGIIITKEFRYKGFLSAKSLINALNEKNLKIARDQNPLTKLPGNATITEFIQKATEDDENRYVIAYLDLDNFKPFNDKFGFRQGDRAILLFADTLRQETLKFKPFLGHIGGDDFFVGFCAKKEGVEEFENSLKKAIREFAQNAESFYSDEDKKLGFIEAKDRFGIVRNFELLTASCATVILEKNKNGIQTDDIIAETANLKKAAKQSTQKYASSILRNNI